MPFPAFDPDARKILFFSRGRGSGHAIPDIEIIRALGRLRPDAEVRIVSYAEGATTFEEFGFPLIDVGLPNTSPIAEMSVIAAKLIGGLRPDIVVSHEEFAAAPAAKIFDLPSIFITDFFDDAELYSMAALKFADQILFTGHAGIFAEPEWVKSKVHYVGPILRNFQYNLRDRAAARKELGIPTESFVLSMFPGSWTEAMGPALNLVLGAFDSLPANSRTLIWVAGRDADLVRRAAGARSAMVVEREWTIERLMVASDVALTKMNRTTGVELHHLGIPAVHLSWGLNPVDDRAVRGLDGTVWLDATTASCGDLAEAIHAAHAAGPSPHDAGRAGAAETCARYIAASLTRESG